LAVIYGVICFVAPELSSVAGENYYIHFYGAINAANSISAKNDKAIPTKNAVNDRIATPPSIFV